LEHADLCASPRQSPAKALRLAPFLQAERAPALRQPRRSGFCCPSDFGQGSRGRAAALLARGMQFVLW